MTINVTKKFTSMEDLKKQKPKPIEEFEKHEKESIENAINILKDSPLEIGRKDK